ncbi:MAG TPA: hypothetical protein VF746_17585 [Longimicrobium sp.]|jgi:hypothetical protein
MNATVTSEPRRPRRGALVWMIASQALMLLSLLPWFVVAMISLAGVDPGAPPGAYAVTALIWAYPLLVLACVWVAWRAWRRGNTRRALVWTTAPLVPTLLLLGYVVWGASPVQ